MFVKIGWGNGRVYFVKPQATHRRVFLTAKAHKGQLNFLDAGFENVYRNIIKMMEKFSKWQDTVTTELRSNKNCYIFE